VTFIKKLKHGGLSAWEGPVPSQDLPFGILVSMPQVYLYELKINALV